MRLPLACLCLLLGAVPGAAQSPIGINPNGQFGVQAPTAPVRDAPEGLPTLAQAAPHLPSVSSVKVGWALLRISPTTRQGRHTHALRAEYHLSPGACEAARAALYDESPSSLCLPVALPPY